MSVKKSFITLAILVSGILLISIPLFKVNRRVSVSLTKQSFHLSIPPNSTRFYVLADSVKLEDVIEIVFRVDPGYPPLILQLIRGDREVVESWVATSGKPVIFNITVTYPDLKGFKIVNKNNQSSVYSIEQTIYHPYKSTETNIEPILRAAALIILLAALILYLEKKPRV